MLSRPAGAPRPPPGAGEDEDEAAADRLSAPASASAASKQSAPVESRATLMAEYRRLTRLHAGSAVPRPPQWTGFRIVPERIEFWTRREPRLHQRELFVRRRGDWKRTILQP